MREGRRFAFRVRARAWSRFGQWLTDQHIKVDPKALALQVAVAGDAVIFDGLLAAHGGDRGTWSRVFDRAQAHAATELLAELGDPTPYRLA